MNVNKDASFIYPAVPVDCCLFVLIQTSKGYWEMGIFNIIVLMIFSDEATFITILLLLIFLIKLALGRLQLLETSYWLYLLLADVYIYFSFSFPFCMRTVCITCF